jgi:hypothetical protein
MRARTISNPVEIPDVAVTRARLSRRPAAVYLGAKMGKNVSVNTIRVWGIPYRNVGRDSIYEIRDLDDFADAQLAAAPVRLGRPSGITEPESFVRPEEARPQTVEPPGRGTGSAIARQKEQI